MTNNLTVLKKDLKSFAKRVKDFKYTESALITFLLTGLIELTGVSFNLFSAENEIQEQTKAINTSITNLKSDFRFARHENDKLLRKTNLELVKLMEQGDHVVKSPWSSWQYGANTILNDWHGTYKGRGDKKEKYPYEGIFERDTNEFNRYVAENSSMYSLLPVGNNSKSASANLRQGLSNYGLASNITQQEPIVSLELSAGISPRVINKKSPNTAPTPPDILLPTFEPKFVNPPVIPNAPHSPTLTLPSFNVNVRSAANDSRPVIMGNGRNSLIQEVAITSGNFKIKRNPIRAAIDKDQREVDTMESKPPKMWNYSYSDYSGRNAFHESGIQVIDQFSGIISNYVGGTSENAGKGRTWGPLTTSSVTLSGESNVGYQKNLAFLSVNKGAMLNNANFLYTNPIMTSNYLNEFVHQDVHDKDRLDSNGNPIPPVVDSSTSHIRAGIFNSVGNGELLKAYDDMVAYQTTTAQKILTANTTIINQHTFLNSGKIIIEGANTSLGNTYSHNGGSRVRQSTINTGNIIFQPYSDGTNIFKKNTAVFVISKDTHDTETTVPQIQDSINYNAGKIKMYTTNAVGLVADPEQKRPVSLINRDTFELYGENSAAIYLKNAVALDIQTTNDKNFTLDTNDNSNSTLSTNSSYKPIKISGDKSIGLYSVASGSTVEGNFALDIGAIGVGNEKFTTTTISNLTDGVNLTNHNINASGSTDDIEGSYGILSKSPIDLTSHQIRIFDKAVGNVGVYPADNVELKLGGGSIELNGGSTAKDNIGIYIDGQGAVTSTGSIKLDGGVGNLGIYAKGGHLPAGVSNNNVNVMIKEVKGSGTKNTVFIYGSDGAKIKLSDGTLPNGTALSTGATYGLNISNATVDTDASTSNKKDTGAVFATGAGTEISINKIATLSTTASPNINITGTKLTDPGTDKYVGFGLMAKDGAIIRAKNNYIKITNGSTAVASVGSGSRVEMNGGKIDYTGKGYALYATPGNTIDISGVKLTLDENAVAYERDLATSFPIITDTNTSIHVKSKDVVVLNVKHASPLNVSSLVSTVVNSWAGLSTIPTYDAGAINYKMTTIDGLSAYNIDQDINKKNVVLGTADNNSKLFVRNMAIRRAKMNLASGKNVTAYLDASDLTNLENSTVIGLDMNSSANAAGRNETQINLAGGSSVNADRTDAGSGAIGLFINYGEANIASGAKVNVEKSGLNDANAKAVGVYAVNGSTVNNEGEINVGGEGSIGVLGISYRKDNNGVLKRNEFGTKPNAGDVGVVNKGKIELDGKKAVGIYIENNDSNTSVPHTIEATNDTNGIINMSGQEAIGMAAKLGNLVNKGTINITADKGTGMFVETDGVRPATITNDSNGTISIGDSTSESVLRTGMFTKNQNVKIINKGKIDAGKNSYAIYGKDVELTSTSELNVGDNGVGIFSTSTTPATPNIDIQAGAKINLGKDEAVGVFLGTDAATGVQANGVRINDAGSIMNIGDNSYGYVLKGVGTTFTNSNAGSVTLGTKSVYLYSDDTTGNITNNVALTSNGSAAGTPIASATGGQNYGLYSAGTVVNNANIDFSRGIGNVGIYSIKGGTATNNSTITVGDSNKENSLYSLGMAAGYLRADSGNIVNNGTITVGKDAIGMYASGPNSTAKNSAGHTINLAGDGSMGMYLDNGAKGVNDGTITTVGNPKEAVGIVVRNGAEFENNGTITINSDGGFAFFKANGGIIKNYGTFHISGGAVKEYVPGAKPTGKEIVVNGVKVLDINAPAGSPTATISANGEIQTPVVTNVSGNRNMLSSNVGLYIDTLRGTNPITGSLGVLGDAADLIIGSEASKVTTSKYIQVPQQIISPYNVTIVANPTIKNWNIYSGALTWISTATLDKSTGLINNIYLAKIPYTAFAGNEPTPVAVTDTYNFLDGLEQRYGVEELGTREKKLFDKLNEIGKNEKILFYQATDEMMGHQYGNVQQRINETGSLLDKEFKYLRNDWRNPSKQNNKIKVFGMRNEYNTDTAGIIDYTSNAYGVAYVHEDETLKLGNSSGWYAGAVNNRFKFKDIGKSRENQTMVKAGIFKTMSPYMDHNGSLRWTIAGDVFAGRNEMKRRFLVVDDIFGAKGSYTSYGAAFKTDLGYDIRMSERTHLRPYGALKMEYGRFNSIKEDDGEVRLEVKGNDYFSVKPEVGMEFKYVQPMAVRTQLSVGLSAAYENELGRVADGKNKARVRYTDADWFGIRGEKEDRRGNGKFDLNIGVDNTRFGVTVNAGYDTKGNNVRGGIGFRAIY